jgi:DNA invertase Pin-like site-specific DNA recombinase
MVAKAFSYIRVSTTQQGRSGLGIEAQRQALQQFAQAEGIEILGECQSARKIGSDSLLMQFGGCVAL